MQIEIEKGGAGPARGCGNLAGCALLFLGAVAVLSLAAGLAVRIFWWAAG